MTDKSSWFKRKRRHSCRRVLKRHEASSDIRRSMINNPELWFLDEPTTGLDPAIAATIKDIIREQKAKGTTAFLTTHNMYIADELCDRVAFIIDGEIKLIDTPKNLKLQYGQKLVDVEYVENDKIVKEYVQNNRRS